MKTKILVFVLLVVLAAFALASCDLSGDCEHTFSENWASDAENHWHAATCEHGEIKDSLAPHVDADENGICDVCENEIGHNHTYSSDWTSDDSMHWKEPTCSHTNVKGEEGLHKDDNTDGVCDVCSGHVHILDAAGYCKGCDKEIKPVDESDIASVISAATARNSKIKNGKVEYVVVIRSLTEGTEETSWHDLEYVFGTNGTYKKRYEDEIVTIGVFPNAVVEKTGKTLITEDWIPASSEEVVVGVTASSVDGVYVNAQPTAFGIDDLSGYYFPVSTFADGYGADGILYSIYTLAVDENASELKVIHDAENNKYTFGFNYLSVQKSMVSGSEVYNVNYFELEVKFTYTDNYAITSLDIKCDCYTNDPGTGDGGVSYEADVDLDYDPETNKMTLRDTATPHTYTFAVTQEVGEREEIDIDVASRFAPTNYNIYTDAGCSIVASSATLEAGDVDLQFYLKAEPADAFTSFLRDTLNVVVTDQNGTETNGLTAYLAGDVIQVMAYVPGTYTISCESLGVTRTIAVTVTGEEILGDYFFEITGSDNYTFDGNLYTFTADKTGVYTFYFPSQIGVWEKSSYDKYVAGDESQKAHWDFQKARPGEKPEPYTVALRAGQTFSFYFMVPVKGVTYVVGYIKP